MSSSECWLLLALVCNLIAIAVLINKALRALKL